MPWGPTRGDWEGCGDSWARGNDRPAARRPGVLEPEEGEHGRGQWQIIPVPEPRTDFPQIKTGVRRFEVDINSNNSVFLGDGVAALLGQTFVLRVR